MKAKDKIKIKSMYSRENGPSFSEISKPESAIQTENNDPTEKADAIKKTAREKFSRTGERETIIYKDENFDVYKRLADVSGPLIEMVVLQTRDTI